MKTTVREISKDESQKWGNIARIRAIDPDFNAVIEALEKEANEKIEVKKVEVEGLMRDVNLAMFGLGLYVYAGEDLPDDVVQPVDDSQKPTKQKAATTPKPEQPPVSCICARCNQPIKRVKLKDGTIMQAAEFAATHEGRCADCYKATRFNVA